MDYWSETMQDDVYLIAHAGWAAAAKPRLIVETKEQKSKEQPDFTVGKQKFKSDLIPAALLIARYFPEEQAAIDSVESELTALDAQLEDLKEEHGGEGGLLEDGVDDKGKITLKAVKARVKEIAGDPEFGPERDALCEYAALLEEQAELKTELKAKKDTLNANVAQKYEELTAAEIKALAVDDKWLATLLANQEAEVDRSSQALTGRIHQLGMRYERALPELVRNVAALTARVEGHLEKMQAWN
jgi:type I restriction enzyme M protein